MPNKLLRSLIVVFLFVSMVHTNLDCRAETSSAPLVMQPTNAQFTIYDWSTARCEDDFIPDAPARVFRRADDQLMLIATHNQNWAMTGSSLTNLQTLCKSILPRTSYIDKGFGDLWIEAVFTNDGEHVFALISQDKTRFVRRQGCTPLGHAGKCWLNDVTSAYSDDMGNSFQLSLPATEAVVRPEMTYPHNADKRIGAFTVSNIVKSEGFYYAIIWIDRLNAEQSGNCIFRTARLQDAQSWHGWNGVGYNSDPTGNTNENCLVIDRHTLPNEVRSLSFEPKSRLWIAVYSARLALNGKQSSQVSGFYYSTAHNLTQWSSPQLLMSASTLAHENNNSTIESYPSLIDFQSKSRNFDTIDHDVAILLFTRQHLSKNVGTMNRDLIAQPIRIFQAQ